MGKHFKQEHYNKVLLYLLFVCFIHEQSKYINLDVCTFIVQFTVFPQAFPFVVFGHNIVLLLDVDIGFRFTESRKKKWITVYKS